MKLSVIGLGYVGCVSAACFAKAGHEVVGVDVNPLKVQIINDGHSPIIEPGIDEMISQSVSEKRLRATTDTAEAVLESDLSLICVGTPSNQNGSLDLTYIRRACQQIAEALKQTGRYHTIVTRSTMLPGTIESVVVPTLEEYSGKKAGQDFGIAINPEFLREGSSIFDFYHPPFTLIGSDNETASGIIRALYQHLDAPVITVGVKEAEMIKYTCNSFHALKVAFANEIGNLCKSLGADSHKVMEIFCNDTKLNLSSAYLKPGFAFGGSCLPKDLRAITYKAKEMDVESPLLNSILPSNKLQIERAVDMVLRSGCRSVGVLGLSFKNGTDDLRESPMVAMVETLIGKGIRLFIYDKDVELARLVGANKQYIEREIPHISSLMVSDLEQVIDNSEAVVIGKKAAEFSDLNRKINSDQIVIDLAGIMKDCVGIKNYHGICW